MVGQAVLHLLIGEVTFLYAPHVFAAFVVLTAFSWFSPLRVPAVVAACSSSSSGACPITRSSRRRSGSSTDSARPAEANAGERYSSLIYGTLTSRGGENVSLIVRALTQRTRFNLEPALSLVPDARAPPNGCWPTTAPVGLSLM